ncbi:unnamed protein product [Mucor hiemalis]
MDDHVLPAITKKNGKKRGGGPLTSSYLKLKLETSYKNSTYIEELQQRLIDAYQSLEKEDLAMIQGTLVGSADVGQVVSQIKLIRERLNTNKARLRFFELVLCWMDNRVYESYRRQGYSADQIYDLMNQDRNSPQATRAHNERLNIGKNVEEIIAFFGPILLVAFELVSKSTMRKANLIKDLTNLLEGTDIRKTLKEYSVPEEINQIFISLDEHIHRLTTSNNALPPTQ